MGRLWEGADENWKRLETREWGRKKERETIHIEIIVFEIWKHFKLIVQGLERGWDKRGFKSQGQERENWDVKMVLIWFLMFQPLDFTCSTSSSNLKSTWWLSIIIIIIITYTALFPSDFNKALTLNKNKNYMNTYDNKNSLQLQTAKNMCFWGLSEGNNWLRLSKSK